jgi:hypothetical protein
VLLCVSGVYCGQKRGAPRKGGEQKEVGRSGRGTQQKKPKTFWVIAVYTGDKKISKNKEFILILNKKCYVCGVNTIKIQSK